MAMHVPCHHCGPRSVEEFLFGEIPRVPDTVTGPDARDVDLVFMRANPEGAAEEAWFHVYGCRRWSYLTRDRATGEWL